MGRSLNYSKWQMFTCPEGKHHKDISRIVIPVFSFHLYCVCENGGYPKMPTLIWYIVNGKLMISTSIISHQPLCFPEQTSCHQHWIPHPSTTIARSWVSPQTTWRWSMCWSSWWLNRLARLAASRNAAMRKREKTKGRTGAQGIRLALLTEIDIKQRISSNIQNHSNMLNILGKLIAVSWIFGMVKDVALLEFSAFQGSRFTEGFQLCLAQRSSSQRSPKLPGCHQGNPRAPQKKFMGSKWTGDWKVRVIHDNLNGIINDIMIW